jgi:Flp pilus assembly protein TadB
MNVLGLLAGAAVGAGLLLVVVGATRGSDPRPRAAAAERGGHLLASLRSRRAAAAAAAALVVWALTRWPALGLVAALVVWGVPVLFSAQRRASSAIDRVEAMEEWVRRLADVLVVGVGLGQAIVTTARTAPDGIAAEVDTLAARISARWDVEEALRFFAADIADPAGDLAVAALVLAQRRKGPGLAAALGAVADALAEEVAMRRRVEADRAKPRATARAVTVITLLVVAVGMLSGSYLAPYATPLGQLVLVGVTAMFAAALTWMNAMASVRPRHRFLARRTAEVGR